MRESGAVEIGAARGRDRVVKEQLGKGEKGKKGVQQGVGQGTRVEKGQLGKGKR